MMARWHGITQDTYKRLIIDSGAVYKDFVDQDNPGTLLGATRGGSTFTIEQEIKDMAVDGAKGPVKGGRRITKVNVKLVINFIEHSADLWQHALPGSEYAAAFSTTVDPSSDDHVEFRRSLEIALADYIDNVVIIGQISGTDQAVVCGIKNALADGNFEMAFTDNEEAGLSVQFTGHFTPCELDDEPWILWYPEDLTTTTAPC
jgi:hypothetical protein